MTEIKVLELMDAIENTQKTADDMWRVLREIMEQQRNAKQSVQRTRAYCECKKPIEFLYGDIYYCKVCNRPCR